MTTATRPWRLRAASIEDCDALALVGAATFLDAFAGILDGEGLIEHCRRQHAAEAYRAALSSSGKAWLAEAEVGGAPIGYALARAPTLEQAEPGDIELKRIYALSRYHGTGIAADLLQAVIAAHADSERLLLGVKDDNHRAIAFYRKHDFDTIGTRRFDVGGVLYDDIVMARPLKQTLQISS